MPWMPCGCHADDICVPCSAYSLFNNRASFRITIWNKKARNANVFCGWSLISYFSKCVQMHQPPKYVYWCLENKLFLRNLRNDRLFLVFIEVIFYEHKVPVICVLSSIDDNPMIEHALKILHAHTFYLSIWSPTFDQDLLALLRTFLRKKTLCASDRITVKKIDN